MTAFPILWFALFCFVTCALAADRPPRNVEPTFLRRSIEDVAAKPMDVTTKGCEYKPLFGAGDSEAAVARGVARFGEISIAARGRCLPVNYAAEEQVYVIMEGSGLVHYGQEQKPVKKHDFMYMPAGIEHWLANASGAPMHLFVMGFKVPEGTPPPSELLIANYDDVKKQNVSGHPDSVVYRLMMGDTNSKRDRLAAGHVLTSLYVMEFEPGGTNFPHHHEAEEEIYVLLDGQGEMVAGSGMDGLEGRFPAKPGDAYFFRLNCTVGFYNSKQGQAHILAVRSLFPRRQ